VAIVSLLAPLGIVGSCAVGPSHDALSIEGVEALSLSIDALHGTQLAAWAAGGEGARRLILVHGTPGSAAGWRRYLVDPIPGLRTIAFDRPGFGRTKPTSAVVAFEDQAAAFAPLLEPDAEGRWPILVGHSLGGPIVARAAADHPDRVGGIVILSGSLDPALEKPRWFNHAADLIPFRIFLSRSWRHSNDEILSAPQHTRELARVLARVRCPVVIIHGTQDSLVPYANVAYMREAFSNAASVEVLTLEGANHFIPWTHERVVRHAVATLARTPGELRTGVLGRAGGAGHRTGHESER
jgi:pimeloyl-ACP methyl ester carboxylesterase